MRIDFHVHSRYSERPSQWILQKIGCPESFTDPMQLYRIAKSKGMSHVTITDHNTIAGALEIAHLPDTFISEEVTTYFPEDRCKLHVLAHDITEAQHRDIQALRENVFDLVAYFRKENILHVSAHPLYSLNGKLSAVHFEKMLLLFNNFELNGARNDRENECVRMVIDSLEPKDIERLANVHDIAPFHPAPWQKKFFGGSDDHSSLNIGRAHTEIIGTASMSEFLAAPQRFNTIPHVHAATPRTMAHNLYGIAYQFYKNKFNLGRYTDKDTLMRFLDRSLRADLDDAAEPKAFMRRIYSLWHYRGRKKRTAGAELSLPALLQEETRKLIEDNPDLFPPKGKGEVDGGLQETRWFEFVNRAANRVTLHFADHLMDHLSGANVFDIFRTIGSAGGLYTMLAPYFVAYTLFSKDKAISEEILRRFKTPLPVGSGDGSQRIAHFTDTFYEINGVALTLQQHVKLARKNNKHLTIITCSADNPSEPGVRNFSPIGTYQLPEYEAQKIFYPPLLEMLDYCYDNRFSSIHTATPGPIGLAALAISRILKLPISGTYHTSLPQYAQVLTGDEAIEDITWRYILWYYDQMDVIYAPSQSTKDELVSKGIAPKKIRVYPRGIDTENFHPGHRNGFYKKRYLLEDGIKILYVGRVSKEKNLHLLAEAFKQLSSTRKGVHLVIVGEGPYLEEMRRTMAGYPCLFAGCLNGETLAAAYASSDLFVFPSTTDTFGNVVLEAQASGLPVIVTDQGGPCENILHGQTGITVPGNDIAALKDAVSQLLEAPARLREMGAAARIYMEERSFEAAFLRSWKMFEEHPAATAQKKSA